MAKLLMTVWPIETHSSGFIPVARALRDRGHRVAFYTGSELQLKLEREGFRVFPFRELDDSFSRCNPGSALTPKMGPRARLAAWQNFLLGSVPGQLQDLERIGSEWQPDGMVCDMTMWGPILVLHETVPLPVAVLAHTAYCIIPGRENPAPGISLPRPGNRRMRLAARILSWGFGRLSAGVPREANRIRRQYGLRPLSGTVVDFTGRMPLYLVPSAPEFDYERRDLPKCVHYIGPCVSAGEMTPAHARTGRPHVLVVDEVHGNDPQLLSIAAQAFAGSAVELTLLVRRGRDLAQLEPAVRAPNVRVEPWVPLRQAVPAADVMVADGHSETVLAALSRGVPLVIVPRMLEQPQVAWRVVASGAGIRLPVRRCTPQRLREAVERVIASEWFSRNARRMAAALARRGGAARAADWIEAMLASNSRPSHEAAAGRELSHSGVTTH